MGFASAFATGLVKGFTRNIENEQKARAKDQEKLDGYRALLMKSVLSGDDVNLAAVNSVKDMIKSGEKQLAEQEPIDIFGRPSQRLKLDMFDTAGVINNVGNTVKIGSVDFPIGKNYRDKTIIKNPEAQASIFFDKLNELGPIKTALMFRNERDRKALLNFYEINLKNFMGPKILNEPTGKIVRRLGPRELVPVHDWMSELTRYYKKSDYQLRKEVLKSKERINDNEFLLPLKFKGYVGERKDAITSAEDLGLDSDEITSLTALAKEQGYSDLGEFIFTTANAFKTPVNFVKALNNTAMLYKLNGANPKSLEEKSKLGEYLINTAKVGDQPLAAAHLFVPLIKIKDDKITKELKRAGFSEALKGEGLDSQWKKITGKTLDKFSEIYTATRQGQQKLVRYIKLLSNAKLKPENYITEGYKFIKSIFGETGTLDQLSDILKLDWLKGVNDENRTAIRTRLNADLENVDMATDEGLLQSQIAVLKYTIAADLARAEDENGRLSDYDLQRNLNKLGTFGFGTLDMARISAKEVLRDVNNRMKQLQALEDVRVRSTANQTISINDMKLLQADRMAQSYILQYEKDNPTRFGKKVEKSIISDMNYQDLFDTDKYRLDTNLQGKNGEPVYQDKKTGGYFVANLQTGSVKTYTGGNVLQAQIDGELAYKDTMSPGNPSSNLISSQTSGNPPSSSTPPVEQEILNMNEVVTNPNDQSQTLNGRKCRIEIRGTGPNQKYFFIFE